MIEHAALNEIVLDILVPNPERDIPATAAALGVDEWAYVLKRGHEHRFLPLLRWTLDQAGALSSLPDFVRTELEEVYRRQVMLGLAAQREMLLVHRILEKGKIDHVFLKGAYLARFAYPQPAMRPMRDLDVLVSPEVADQAYSVLLQGGCRQNKNGDAFIADVAQNGTHLPPLRGPGGRLAIELHLRLDEPDSKLSKIDAFMNTEKRAFENGVLTFMSPEHLLIHLCVHAADRHGFDNGPLTVADIGFLLGSVDLDWDFLWATAERLQLTRSVAISLALAESCWGRLNIGRRDRLEPVPGPMLSTVRQLCLRSFADRGNVNVRAELARHTTRTGAFIVLAGRLFPSRSKLQQEFGVPRSTYELVGNYFRFWRRILTERAPNMLRSLPQSEANSEAANLNHLNEWLMKKA